MKTIVVCAIFVLELVSSYPFPEALPGQPYYGTYEPQHIEISNLAHSPDLYQQQLYVEEQNNIRKYKDLLRNQDLNQRLASQMLTRPSYNIQPVLNTVREPYINAIPLQRQIQTAQYEAPITQQYYPVQRQQPIRQYQPVRSQQYPGTESRAESRAEADAGHVQGSHQTNNYPLHYSQYNAQQMAYNPRIQQVLASTPLKKRYLVLHPNGTIEHIDKIEHIVEQHPNYILVNAGSVAPKPNEAVGPNSVPAQSPVAPQQPMVPVGSAAPTAPVAPVAPVAPKPPVAPTAPVAPAVAAVPSVPAAPVAHATAVAQANAVPAPPVALAEASAPAPVNPASSPIRPAAPPVPAAPPAAIPPPGPVLPPTIQNGPVPGPKPTVPPPTGSTTVPPPVSAPTAQPPVNINGTVPSPKPSVPPPIEPTTKLPPTTPPVLVTATATATAIYPPPTTPLPPTTAQSTSPTVTAEPTTTPSPPATTIPTVTDTATATATSAPEGTTCLPPTSEDPTTQAPDCSTTVAPFIKPSDPQNDLDVLQVNGVKPVVWFRTQDQDFWKKLTSGDEVFDVVYFFNVPRAPRVTKETTTTIHADGTVVEEITQHIYDDEDSPPRVIKTTKITKPDGTQSTT